MLEVENNFGIEVGELLRIKYVDECKSKHTIAEELNISYVTTVRWLNAFGIYSRKIKW